MHPHFHRHAMRTIRVPRALSAPVLLAPQAPPRPRTPFWRQIDCPQLAHSQRRGLSAGSPLRDSANRQDSHQDASDPRVKDIGREIIDDYAHVRDNYDTPRNPLVLAHGLLGFSVIRANQYLPPVYYWHGISNSLEALCPSLPIITPSVPPSGSIPERAQALATQIAASLAPDNDRPVNIIAHSMGGLDARYMISRLQDHKVRVASLTTIATPHRGSAFADFMMDKAGLEGLYPLIDRLGLGTGAFQQLTARYMEEEFNPQTPDAEGTRYFSFGARTPRPGLFSPFLGSWGIINSQEGPNDGLVSVESSKWGQYRGTLRDVSHLDLINWTNRLKWEAVKLWTGKPRNFNAVALYLDIADMLAKEGL